MELSKTKIIYTLNDYIDTRLANGLMGYLNNCLNDGYEEITIAMNSGGGNVSDGIALYNYMNNFPIPITVHNIGNVSSIAFIVFLAGVKRYTCESGVFMTHPTNFTPSKLTHKTALDIALSLEIDDERTEYIIKDKLPQIPHQVLEDRRESEVFIRAGHSFDYGIVHDVRPFIPEKGVPIYRVSVS